ncbi:glycosyltransferase family 4 protein [Sphingomonas profundi]|uniref:glycosyltransferase family 4 protein n=1 Tax=Alterirhizorhabdus profundi TaxID=2681549 RepID=UPI0012E731B4|nr:glycosyltransferase family 1 protein [Sphingomonas profundi]
MTRIAMDARMLGEGGTGVSTYARSLAAALVRIADAPLVVRSDGARRARLLRALPPGARRLVPGGGHGGISEGLVGRDIFRVAQVHFDLYGRPLPLRAPGPPGIMHWTYPVPLRLLGWRNVYTVHDAIPLDQPDLTPINVRRHARLLRAIMRDAAAIVTVSDDARGAIAAATGCDPAFVANCAQPVILPCEPPPPPAEFAPGSYFLFCGSIEPRKNLARLAAAHRASGTALPLLIAGPDGWRAEEVTAAIAAGGGHVVRLPYQGRDALIGLVAHARALLFPSLAEGFGLPVAEAMALGTAVMTSAGGALAETAGGAALLVDPQDIAAMAGAIADLGRNDALVADLAERGRVRAADFSLDRFAARLRRFYDGLPAPRAT